ncbi:MAG: hypothetical protein HY719_09425 [Planctomycetes bacterium]|nr:hypothetical protein [Planctomycetota bacterium]
MILGKSLTRLSLVPRVIPGSEDFFHSVGKRRVLVGPAIQRRENLVELRAFFSADVPANAETLQPNETFTHRRALLTLRIDESLVVSSHANEIIEFFFGGIPARTFDVIFFSYTSSCRFTSILITPRTADSAGHRAFSHR